MADVVIVMVTPSNGVPLPSVTLPTIRPWAPAKRVGERRRATATAPATSQARRTIRR